MSAVFYGAFATSERQDWDLKKEEKEGVENPTFADIEENNEKFDSLTE